MVRKSSLLVIVTLLGLTVVVVVVSILRFRRDEWRTDVSPSQTLPPLVPVVRLQGRPSEPTSAPAPGPTPYLADRLALNTMIPADRLALAGSLPRATLGRIPRVVRTTPTAVEVGEERRFWIGDLDVSRIYQITATLRLQSEHLQMWVHDQVEVDQSSLEQSARVFEDSIYPTNHDYFGEEWTPGVDGDPRLLVLNARFSGASGYFSSANEYSRMASPYSNECEMFVVNVGVLPPGTSAYDSVLAHEFQHLIHWHLDSNEDAWLNEGASALAEDVNGFGGARPGVRQFELMPDVQLNAWGDDEAQVGAHYGAAYLMLRYLLDHFGRETLREVVRSPLNGISSIEAALAHRGVEGGFDELFADWVVANALDDPKLDEGRFGYPNTDVGVEHRIQVASYPFTLTGQVHQYAADYVALLPVQAGPLRLSFQGEPRVKLVPNEPASGRFQWWSNRGDASYSFLEHTFDLTGVLTATLSFDLWYDIERGWDYAYVRASTDGGRSWQLLGGPHMTDYDPNGNALGPGYTGTSGLPPQKQTDAEPIWVREELDLGAYCGAKVLLRFDYVTDEEINRPGLCLDNFDLGAVGLADDVEEGEGDWRCQGFIRHDNVLAQRYVVQVVEFGREVRVRRMPVGPDGRGERIVQGFGDEVSWALLIVSAMAPVTTESASYRLEMEQMGPTFDAVPRVLE